MDLKLDAFLRNRNPPREQKRPAEERTGKRKTQVEMVLEVLQAQKGRQWTSKVDLVRDTGLSHRQVTQAVNKLIRMNHDIKKECLDNEVWYKYG